MERPTFTDELVDLNKVNLCEELASCRQIIAGKDITAIQLLPEGLHKPFIRKIQGVFEDDQALNTIVLYEKLIRGKLTLRKVVFDSTIPFCIFTEFYPDGKPPLNPAELKRMWDLPPVLDSHKIKLASFYSKEKGYLSRLQAVYVKTEGRESRYITNVRGVFSNPETDTITLLLADDKGNFHSEIFDNKHTRVITEYIDSIGGITGINLN